MEAAKKPADLSKSKKPKRASCGDVTEQHIVAISPKLVAEQNDEKKRMHCLDSCTVRRPSSDRAVMMREVNNMATHVFDTCDFKCHSNETATLDTNALCKSVAYKDPNTNVNHIITFENVYDFVHEFEEADPSVKVEPSFRPDMDIQKQVEMSVDILADEHDKQLANHTFIFHFKHKIRLYCPHFKLQTWSTSAQPSDVVDYSDIDPYLSASSAVNPTLLQVHYQRITHHVKLVHLLCRPHHISFQKPGQEKLHDRKQQQAKNLLTACKFWKH